MTFNLGVNLYNLQDVVDLIAAKDANIANLVQSRGLLPQPPDSTWDQQFADVQNSYADARSRAQAVISDAKVIALGTSAWTYEPATNVFNDILSSLNVAYASQTPAPGSFDDLDARLRSNSQNIPIPPTPTLPQPSGENPEKWLADHGLDVPTWTLPSWVLWLGGGAAALFLANQARDLFRK